MSSASVLGASSIGLWSFSYIPKLEVVDLISPSPGQYPEVDRLRDEFGLELRIGCTIHGGKAKVRAH